MFYVLPVRDTVLFPGILAPLFVGRARSLKALELALLDEKRRIFVVAQKDIAKDDPDPEDLYTVGTLCSILQIIRLPDGSVKVLLEGRERMHVRSYGEDQSALTADTSPSSMGYQDSKHLEALRLSAVQEFERYVNVHPNLPTELTLAVSATKDASQAADMIASHMMIDVDKKQNLLECFNVATRLELLLKYLATEIDLLELAAQIHTKVQQEMDQNQRQYYLREQLKAIQQELGVDDPPEIRDLKEQAEQTELPEGVRKRVDLELQKLSKMAPMTPESTVSRSYIEWLLALPWTKSVQENLDLEQVRCLLDSNHYGLKKVKDRLLEYLAVRKLAGKSARAQILCLIGPPGVGKTSLGKSIAEALKRPFVSFSLGGMRDEAEIRGHRRTYIGSMPGRIIQKIRLAECRNPVILLDEVDKIGSDYRGDPASALLEVLDPEQNSQFTDHYLEMPFDLSDVLFITTANVAHTIPQPLLDRMEMIDLPSYMPEEKFHIAKEHLLPRLYRQSGLTRSQLSIGAPALRKLITEYTHEAGVRELDRKLATIFRKTALQVLSSSTSSKRRVISPGKLADYLGASHRPDLRIPQEPSIGVATGLAWTGAGGEVLVIEAASTAGKGEITLTGNLGAVMKESARTAIGFLKSRWKNLSNRPEPDWSAMDVHIHVPEGAIPKDGPSAGITMATVLMSIFSGRRFLPGYAMTGEISLRGNVLPIGGLREKALAAKRNGILKLIVPFANQPDIQELEPWVMEDLTFIPVRSVEEVFSNALEEEL